MPLLRAKLLAELPPGTVAEFETRGGTYAICNVGGDIHCVDGICPHAEWPLTSGKLEGFILTCPWHRRQFDVRTGEGEEYRLKTFPVLVKDGQIFIET